MAATKTRAFVLRLLPYRDSSFIAYLLTESDGLLHGVARGIRSRGKGTAAFLERGFLIELLVYTRPNRELHTLASPALLEGFPTVRSSLLRTTARDLAFEIALSGIHPADPHPELFGFMAKYLEYLESCAEECVYPFALWRFLYRFPALLGFGMDLQHCRECGRPPADGGELDIASGGLVCPRCRQTDRNGRLIPLSALEILLGKRRNGGGIRETLDAGELRRITRLLTDFCRYHFEFRGDYRSMAFLEESMAQR